MRYTNTLTYLLTYLLSALSKVVICFAGVFIRRVFLCVAAAGSRVVLQQQLGAQLSACLRQHRRPVRVSPAAPQKPNAGEYEHNHRQSAGRVRTSQTGSLAASTIRAGKLDSERVDRGVEPYPAGADDAAVRGRRVRRRCAPDAVSRHRGRDETGARRTGGGRRSQQRVLVQNALVLHRSDSLPIV